MNQVTVKTEHILLLIKQQEKMGIAEIIGGIVAGHGNRVGLSLGWTIVGWLSYILSESDHRLSFVEDWVADHWQTLYCLLPGLAAPQDFSDDRLGETVRILSDDQIWEAVE